MSGWHSSVFVSLSIAVAGCSGGSFDKEEAADTQQDTRCGTTDENFDVELYDGSVPGFSTAFVARYQGAFGRHCSGTLIGPDLFLTANHEDCPVTPGQQVGFNCQVSASDPNPPDPNAAAAANCEWFASESVANYPGIDASISKLSGNPGYKYGWVFPTASPLTGGEPIALFHHPLSGRRKEVGFGTVGSLTSTGFYHQIDSRGGSSGGGILNQAGLLVGIHLRGGCTDTDGANGANLMTAIIDQVPEVRGLVTSGYSITVM